jgi:hypothetical protein
MTTLEAAIVCVVFGKPIQLAQAILDDHGKPVHEECNVPRGKAEKRDPR